MYFPKEDSWMNPDINIRRLESIEQDFIQKLEKLQDPKIIIQFQKGLNNLLKAKMEWIKLKDRMELFNNGL